VSEVPLSILYTPEKGKRFACNCRLWHDIIRHV